jgi:hypothetical protein
LRDWVPRNHMVHFILDAVDQLPAEFFLFNHRGTGESQYPHDAFPVDLQLCNRAVLFAQD